MEKNQRKRAIDTEFLRSVIENDFEFEKELFAIFSENAHRNLTKLEDAIVKSDNQSWYMASHAFKGASASIGAFELSKILEVAQKSMDVSKEEKVQMMLKIREEFLLVLDFINEELLER